MIARIKYRITEDDFISLIGCDKEFIDDFIVMENCSIVEMESGGIVWECSLDGWRDIIFARDIMDINESPPSLAILIEDFRKLFEVYMEKNEVK